MFELLVGSWSGARNEDRYERTEQIVKFHLKQQVGAPGLTRRKTVMLQIRKAAKLHGEGPWLFGARDER